MDCSWALISRLAPEQAENIGVRAMLLERIEAQGPIGRRALANALNLSEREIRSAADALKGQGLVSFSSAGMSLAKEAKAIMPEVRQLCRNLSGLGGVERELSRLLNLKKLSIVAGNADENPSILKDMGRVAAQRLGQLLANDMIIAIAGGRTMQEVASCCSPSASGITVVPARGGIGSSASTQADSVAGLLAEKMNAECHLIHLPDGLSPATLSEIIKLPSIKKTLDYMHAADIIIFGIGRADEMAKRRGLELAQTETLLRLGAVGEALGDFFNIDGKTVYQSPSVGMELKLHNKTSKIIAVAAGKRKARAILAAMRRMEVDSLIIDEGAAREILKLIPIN